MLTRPKLIEPFQMVRIRPPVPGGGPASTSFVGRCESLEGPGEFAPQRRIPSAYDSGCVAIETTTRIAADRTIARLWQDAVTRGWEAPAYLAETSDGWEPVSGQEAALAVDELANGLLALGVRKGDAFAILASTRLEWALFDLALALIGAIGAPIYPNSSPRDCAYVVEHSEAVGILCEDDGQRQKVESLALEHVLTFGDLPELRAKGRGHMEQHPRALSDASSAIDPEDLFTYI
ncbi:MAG: hypothetical protein E6G13_13335, partial [Actinobacteria bacterium]